MLLMPWYGYERGLFTCGLSSVVGRKNQNIQQNHPTRHCCYQIFVVTISHFFNPSNCWFFQLLDSVGWLIIGRLDFWQFLQISKDCFPLFNWRFPQNLKKYFRVSLNVSENKLRISFFSHFSRGRVRFALYLDFEISHYFRPKKVLISRLSPGSGAGNSSSTARSASIISISRSE